MPPTPIEHPRSRDELNAIMQRDGALTVLERELPPTIELRRIEGILDDFYFQRALFYRDERIELADIRRRGIVRDLGPHAEAILEMLRHPETIEFVRDVLGERRYAEGAQLHRMPPGASLAAHHHGLSDVFAIFHFSQPYTGGAYFEERANARTYPRIPPYSLFISRGTIVHGVEPITTGERHVLVTLWSESAYRS